MFSLRFGGLLRCCHRIDELKEVLDASDAECIPNSLADADQIQAATFFLAVDMCTYQRTDPGRIHVRDVGEIQHECAGSIAADLGLKIGKGGENQGPGETQNALSLFWTGEIFDDERLLGHREILAVGAPKLLQHCQIFDSENCRERGLSRRRFG